MRSHTFLLAAALLPVACAPKNEFAPPPPPTVTVTTPVVEDTTIYVERPGRTAAFQRAEIRARVRGFLQGKHFHSGDYVNAKDKLFTIEQPPFEAAVRSAEGKLAQAQASLEIAKANRMKREDVYKKSGAVSEIDVLSAKADEQAAEASIAIAQAELEQAKIDLSYTTVTAQIDGRVSDWRVDVGNLVGGSEATLLTTVVKDNPIYVIFEFSERQILPYLSKRPKSEKESLDIDKDIKVQLRLTNGEIYAHPGQVDFLDNEVDPETGTMRVRAVFPNEEGGLAAGFFGNVLIPISVKGAVLVPTRAVQRDLAGDFVLVVGEKNIVERRGVTAASVIDGRRVIEKGLDGSERVIIDGVQSAREGMPVNPQEAAKEEKPADSGKEKAPEAA